VGSGVRRRVDLEDAAEGAHALTYASEPDVAVEQSLTHAAWRDAPPIIVHLEHHGAGFVPEGELNPPGSRVLARVGQEFATQCEQDLAVVAWLAPRVYRHDDLGLSAPRVVPGDLLERGAQADVVKDVRVQLEDLLAQFSEREVKRVVQTSKALRVCGPLRAA
jgi:hypothetical protein